MVDNIRIVCERGRSWKKIYKLHGVGNSGWYRYQTSVVTCRFRAWFRRMPVHNQGFKQLNSSYTHVKDRFFYSVTLIKEDQERSRKSEIFAAANQSSECPYTWFRVKAWRLVSHLDKSCEILFCPGEHHPSSLRDDAGCVG